MTTVTTEFAEPTIEEAETLAARILAAAGAPAGAARQVATSLVLAERMGHASHGLIRVLEYRGSALSGEVDPRVVPEVLRRSGGTAVVDGHWGWGHLAAGLATQVAAELAAENGVGIVAVRSCNHSGRLGEWAESLAAQGLIGLGWLSCGPAVAPLGGLDRELGTNPIAVAVPGGPAGRPIVLDFATAGYAEGKVRVAARNGKPVPPGVLQTADGRPTTDPNDFYSGGAILPFGGHKGHGLSIMIQLVSDALCGGGPNDRPDSSNHLVLVAISPDSLADPDVYRNQILAVAARIQGSRPAEKNAPVLLPGDVEARTMAGQPAGGLRVTTSLWAELERLDREGEPVS